MAFTIPSRNGIYLAWFKAFSWLAAEQISFFLTLVSELAEDSK
jgi:hypothetical protein